MAWVGLWLICLLWAQSKGEEENVSLTFVTIGDWGSPGNIQTSVAAQMAISAQSFGAEFIISTGDNFYEHGVSSETDSQWDTTWRNVYYDPRLNLTWFSVLGNHDYRQNPDAQIVYSKQGRDSRWIMDDHYFSKTFTSNETGVVVQILFIDSIYLAPTASHSTPVNDPDARSSEEIAWLESQLNSSDADWIFVVGHYPVFSIGEHGDTSELQGALQKILEYYEVDAYICGHDHTLQHLSNGPVEYYVSGNGGKKGSLKSPSSTMAESVNFAVVDPGFMIHEVGVWNMTVRMIDSDGVEIYSYVQQRNFRVDGFGGLPRLPKDDDSHVMTTFRVLLVIGVLILSLVLCMYLTRTCIKSPRFQLGISSPTAELGMQTKAGHTFDEEDLEDDEIGHSMKS